MITVTVRHFLGLGLIAVGVWLAAAAVGRAAGEAATGDAGHGAEAAAGEAPAEHGGSHAEHDPYDLSHANAGPDMTNPIEWRYDLALASFLVFLSLLTLLGWFAWPKISEGLELREKSIAGRIEAAERSEKEAAEQLRQYQEKLAAAAQEAEAILQKARRDAEGVAERIRQEAQHAASRERDRAVADIQLAKNAALREVSQTGADLAVRLAGRIMRRELNANDQASLIAEALEQLPSRN